MSVPTLLLLHAFPLDARMWDGVRGLLEERGRRAVAPTLPVAPGRRTLAAWADDVLTRTDGPLVPVGVSVGGYLAFELWRRAAGRIRALVLCDCRATADDEEARAGRAHSIETIRSGGPAALWHEMEDRLLAPSASREMRDRAREIALDRDPDDLVATVEAIRDRPDSTPALAMITAPVLVVVGEDDALVPLADAAALATAIPGARLRAIPQAGHLPPLERPAAFTAVVSSFLAEVA